MHRNLKLILLLFIFFLGLLAYWMVEVEPAMFIQKNYEAPILAKNDIQTFRIIHISDLHLGSRFIDLQKLNLIVRKINEAKADILLITGDFLINNVVGGSKIAPEEMIPILSQLKTKYGVFATPGNHDWWNDMDRLKSALKKSNVQLLQNESVRITVEGGDIHLVGIDDGYTNHDDIEKAFSGVPLDAKPIVFTHDPAVFLDIKREGELFLAGHTHGGQVALPIIGAILTFSHSPREIAYGWKTWNGHRIQVSSGIGTSVLPIRLLRPPEYVTIDIVRSERHK